mgnify:CR=1 FL=1
MDPSIGGNVSPSSTITGNDKVPQTDLRQFIEIQEVETEKIEEGNEPKSSERRKDSSEVLESRDSLMPDGREDPKPEVQGGDGAEDEGNVTQRSEQGITENGGDNDAFKSLLAEELARINQQDQD